MLFTGLKLRRFATIPMGSTLPPNVATPGPSAPHFSAVQGPTAATTSTVPPPERFCRLGNFHLVQNSIFLKRKNQIYLVETYFVIKIINRFSTSLLRSD